MHVGSAAERRKLFRKNQEIVEDMRNAFREAVLYHQKNDRGGIRLECCFASIQPNKRFLFPLPPRRDDFVKMFVVVEQKAIYSLHEQVQKNTVRPLVAMFCSSYERFEELRKKISPQAKASLVLLAEQFVKMLKPAGFGAPYMSAVRAASVISGDTWDVPVEARETPSTLESQQLKLIYRVDSHHVSWRFNADAIPTRLAYRYRQIKAICPHVNGDKGKIALCFVEVSEFLQKFPYTQGHRISSFDPINHDMICDVILTLATSESETDVLACNKWKEFRNGLCKPLLDCYKESFSSLATKRIFKRIRKEYDTPSGTYVAGGAHWTRREIFLRHLFSQHKISPEKMMEPIAHWLLYQNVIDTITHVADSIKFVEGENGIIKSPGK